MFNLGTGFATTQAIWYYYSTDPEYFGTYNTNFIADKELESIALDMKRTDPQDQKGWAEKWIRFQKRWNTLMPDIPLYSDVYHDFFNPKIVGYDSSPTWQFQYAILRADVK
jgi:peptide/nickel transport system substrate-binding protein